MFTRVEHLNQQKISLFIFGQEENHQKQEILGLPSHVNTCLSTQNHLKLLFTHKIQLK